MLKKITFFVFWISSQERATMTLEIQMAAEWVPSDGGLAPLSQLVGGGKKKAHKIKGRFQKVFTTGRGPASERSVGQP